MIKLQRFQEAQAEPGHEGTILAMDVLPPGVQAPFDHAWGYLEPHKEMAGHQHPTQEIYFFHRGQGTVIVGEEEAKVSAGDCVEIPAETYHTVRNNSDEPLLWFALWWPIKD